MVFLGLMPHFTFEFLSSYVSDAIANFLAEAKCCLGQGRWLSEAGNSLGDVDRHQEEEVKACFNRSGSEPGRK